MAKFKAGDMITDGHSVLLVNRVYIEENEYSFDKGKEIYSLDNGNGFADGRSAARYIDETYVICPD